MRYLIVLTLLIASVKTMEAKITSRIVGQFQIEDYDCFVLRVELWSDNNTIDPRDDMKIYSYFTVVGNGCNQLPLNGNDQMKLHETENDALSNQFELDKCKLYPNPASDFVELKFENRFLGTDGHGESGIIIYIINNHGNIIKYFQFNTYQDRFLLEINGVPKGMYWIASYIGNQLIASKPFVKI